MTDPRHGRLSFEAEAARVRREGSGQSASRQHEAKRCPGFCSAAVPDPRAVQAAPGNRRNRRLGFPAVGDDPGHDRREVSSLGEDRGALDDLAAGGVRTRQPRDQSANRVVVHFSHPSPLCDESKRLEPFRNRPRHCRGDGPLPGMGSG
jgi:hypothetical protein